MTVPGQITLITVAVFLLAGCSKKEEDLAMIKSATNIIMTQCEVSPRIELITTNHETRLVVACDSYPKTEQIPQ